MKDIYSSLAYKGNMDIHTINYKGQLLYFLHYYNKNHLDKIDSGDVFIVYRDTKLKDYHNHEKPILHYNLINTIQGNKHIELSNIFIDEEYRGKGLGSLILKYFENKIVNKYFCNIEYIKGVLLLGEEKKLTSFYKKNGYTVRGSNITKKL